MKEKSRSDALALSKHIETSVLIRSIVWKLAGSTRIETHLYTKNRGKGNQWWRAVYSYITPLLPEGACEITLEIIGKQKTADALIINLFGEWEKSGHDLWTAPDAVVVAEKNLGEPTYRKANAFSARMREHYARIHGMLFDGTTDLDSQLRQQFCKDAFLRLGSLLESSLRDWEKALSEIA